MYKYFDISAFLFALLRENPAHSAAVSPSFRATTTRTQCVCKEDRYIQIAFSARRLRQRGRHATSFCPYGKTCTASFRGDAWQNAILPRFTDRRRMKVFCDKIIVKREVTAQNTLRLRDAITKQYSFAEKAPFRRFQTSAP